MTDFTLDTAGPLTVTETNAVGVILTVSLTAREMIEADSVIRWVFVPTGLLPGSRADFVDGLSGTFSHGAIASGVTTMFTIPVAFDELDEPVKNYKLQIYSGAENPDVAGSTHQIGDDIDVTVIDDDIDSADTNFARLFGGTENIQVYSAGTTDRPTFQGGDGADVYVITGYQYGNVTIDDPTGVVVLDSTVDIVRVSDGVDRLDGEDPVYSLVGRLADGAPNANLVLELSTGAEITVNNANAGLQYRIGDGASTNFAGFLTGLGLSELTRVGTGARLSVTFGLAENADLVPFDSFADYDPNLNVDDAPLSRLLASSDGTQVYGTGTSDTLDLQGGDGGDVYVITRFQYGAATINDPTGVIKFEDDVTIANVGDMTGRLARGAPNADLVVTLDTGGVLTVVGANSADLSYQLGTADVTDFAGFLDAVGFAETGRSGSGSRISITVQRPTTGDPALQTPYTVSGSVVNAAYPVPTDTTIDVDEGSSLDVYTFTLADFGYTDADDGDGGTDASASAVYITGITKGTDTAAAAFAGELNLRLVDGDTVTTLTYTETNDGLDNSYKISAADIGKLKLFIVDDAGNRYDPGVDAADSLAYDIAGLATINFHVADRGINDDGDEAKASFDPAAPNTAAGAITIDYSAEDSPPADIVFENSETAEDSVKGNIDQLRVFIDGDTGDTISTGITVVDDSSGATYNAAEQFVVYDNQAAADANTESTLFDVTLDAVTGNLQLVVLAQATPPATTPTAEGAFTVLLDAGTAGRADIVVGVKAADAVTASDPVLYTETVRLLPTDQVKFVTDAGTINENDTSASLGLLVLPGFITAGSNIASVTVTGGADGDIWAVTIGTDANGQTFTLGYSGAGLAFGSEPSLTLTFTRGTEVFARAKLAVSAADDGLTIIDIPDRPTALGLQTGSTAEGSIDEETLVDTANRVDLATYVVTDPDTVSDNDILITSDTAGFAEKFEIVTTVNDVFVLRRKEGEAGVLQRDERDGVESMTTRTLTLQLVDDDDMLVAGATQTFTVTVENVDEAPALVASDTRTVIARENAAISITINPATLFVDPESNPFTLALVADAADLFGLTLAADGVTVTGTAPTTAQLGETSTFTIQATQDSDGTLVSELITYTLTVVEAGTTAISGANTQSFGENDTEAKGGTLTAADDTTGDISGGFRITPPGAIVAETVTTGIESTYQGLYGTLTITVAVDTDTAGAGANHVITWSYQLATEGAQLTALKGLGSATKATDTDEFVFGAGVGISGAPGTTNITITIAGVNDAPMGASNAVPVSLVEDATHDFQVANFGYADAEDDQNSTAGQVRIDSVTNGSIRLITDPTVDVDISSPLTLALDATGATGIELYRFVPDADYVGTASVAFTVIDSDGTPAAASNTLSFDVTTLPDNPTASDIAPADAIIFQGTNATAYTGFTEAEFRAVFMDGDDDPSADDMSKSFGGIVITAITGGSLAGGDDMMITAGANTRIAADAIDDLVLTAPMIDSAVTNAVITFEVYDISGDSLESTGAYSYTIVTNAPTFELGALATFTLGGAAATVATTGDDVIAVTGAGDVVGLAGDDTITLDAGAGGVAQRVVIAFNGTTYGAVQGGDTIDNFDVGTDTLVLIDSTSTTNESTLAIGDGANELRIEANSDGTTGSIIINFADVGGGERPPLTINIRADDVASFAAQINGDGTGDVAGVTDGVVTTLAALQELLGGDAFFVTTPLDGTGDSDVTVLGLEIV